VRLGIFGGSFDPVHLGHLLLAEYCREAVGLDRVWFVPAAQPPHKQTRELSPAEHRVEMLKLAIAGHQPFEVSLVEIERGGVSYTWETLHALKQERPHDELFLLIGADTLIDLPNWRKPETVLELATPVAVGRAGSQIDWDVLAPLVEPARLEAFRSVAVNMPSIELSSSEIRRRVSEGRSVRFQTPRAVEKYIESAGLYRSGGQE